MATPTKATSSGPHRAGQRLQLSHRKGKWTGKGSPPVQHPAEPGDIKKTSAESGDAASASGQSPKHRSSHPRSEGPEPLASGDVQPDTDPAPSPAPCNTSELSSLSPSTSSERSSSSPPPQPIWHRIRRQPLRISSPPEADKSSESHPTITAVELKTGETSKSASSKPRERPSSTSEHDVTQIPLSSSEVESSTRSELTPPSINMGQLVPIGDSKGKTTAIRLYLPDDGREATILNAGWQDGCHIKIQGEGVGRIHCYIKLTIGLSGDRSSPYVRTAMIKPVADYVTTVTQSDGTSASSSDGFLLTPGCEVVLGTGATLAYRYAGPEDAAPTAWISREFIWSPDMKADFGGTRSNSAVYLVKKRGPSGSRHALKIISIANFVAYPQLEKIASRELQILRVLRHENVIELQGYRRDELQKQIIFILPEMMGGNLRDFVNKNRSPVKQERLSNGLAPSVAKQMLSALKHLHGFDIVHRDIKPENILLAEDWSSDMDCQPNLVLGDFGISRCPRELRTELFEGATLEWMAPRSFRLPTVPDHEMDLWGLGLVIWFIIAGPPKPWGDSKLRVKDDEDYNLDWERLTDLDVTSECEDFVLGFLVGVPELCRSIEASEKHDWVEHGNTVDWTVDGDAVFDAKGVELTSSCTRWQLFIDD